MATTFSTAKVALDEIAGRIQQNRQRLQQSQALSATAEALDAAGAGPAAEVPAAGDVLLEFVGAPGTFVAWRVLA